MKKLLALILALTLCFSLVACAGSKQETPAAEEATKAPEAETEAPAEESGDNDFVIGYNNNGDNDTFSKTLHDGTEAAAAEAGIPFLYAESNFQPDKIQASVNTLVLQGADVIVDFNVTPDAYTNLIPDLEAQGVPVLMVDTFCEGAYFFGANNSVAGNKAGNCLADYAIENWDSNIDRVITIGTWTQGTVVMDRCNGIIDGVVDRFPDFDKENKYHEIECGGSGVDQMSNILTKVKDLLTMYPDDHNIAIGLYSEAFVQAVFSAVEQAGREDDVILVTLNCEDYFKEDVKTDAHPYWIASVAFFPERYGEYIVDICEKFKNGEEVPVMNYMDHVAATREMVKELYPEYFE